MGRTRTFIATDFCIDMSDEIFHGYSDGGTWNGFACPYFEYHEAVRVLESLGNIWEYNSASKVFAVRNVSDPDDYELQEFEAIEIDLDGQKIEVYGIGAYAWIWDYCE